MWAMSSPWHCHCIIKPPSKEGDGLAEHAKIKQGLQLVWYLYPEFTLTRVDQAKIEIAHRSTLSGLICSSLSCQGILQRLSKILVASFGIFFSLLDIIELEFFFGLAIRFKIHTFLKYAYLDFWLCHCCPYMKQMYLCMYVFFFSWTYHQPHSGFSGPTFPSFYNFFTFNRVQSMQGRRVSVWNPQIDSTSGHQRWRKEANCRNAPRAPRTQVNLNVGTYK